LWYHDPELEKETLNRINELAISADLPLFVLRNFNSLPDSVDNSDIDLAISVESLCLFLNIIEKLVEDSDEIFYFLCSKHSNLLTIHISRFQIAKIIGYGVHLDLFFGMPCKAGYLNLFSYFKHRLPNAKGFTRIPIEWELAIKENKSFLKSPVAETDMDPFIDKRFLTRIINKGKSFNNYFKRIIAKLMSTHKLIKANRDRDFAKLAAVFFHNSPDANMSLLDSPIEVLRSWSPPLIAAKSSSRDDKAIQQAQFNALYKTVKRHVK